MTPRVFVAVLVTALLVAACGSDDGSQAKSSLSPAAPVVTEADGEAGGFPVTVENCGTETTYDAAPERAVVIFQHPTEILLALGLADRMVGTAYMDSAIRSDLLSDYETVPELAEEDPSREQVLAVEPDIVIAGYASGFDDDAAGNREGLADLGIATHLTTIYCPDFAGASSLDLVAEDITGLGAIFGVGERADQLVAHIRAPIDEVTEALVDVEPVEVFVYDSGTDQAFTAAGYENTTTLIELAGGRNVFDDVNESFTEVSWEDVVARDPEVILILNYGTETVEQKQDFLRAHPVASTLRAVQEERFVIADLTDVVPGIRNGEAVATLATGFHPDRL